VFVVTNEWRSLFGWWGYTSHTDYDYIPNI